MLEICDLRAFEYQARQNGYSRIAGVDEAGRGPLAGPVVSAAVILPDSFAVPGVNDSKCLTAKTRDCLYDDIYRHAVSIGIGIIDPVEIDRINILQASLAAMIMAVRNLKPQPDFLYIDGNFCTSLILPQEALIDGDAKCVSIAAASIIAKVTRDRIMSEYHIDYPEFDFPRHKGYATKAHLAAITQFGCCPIHRRSFRGVLPALRQQALF